MTGQELIDWIAEHNAKGLQILIARRNSENHFWNDCVPVKPKIIDGYLEIGMDGSGRKVRYNEIDPAERTYSKYVEL